MQTSIVQNMDTIRQLFQEVKLFCEQEKDLETLVTGLDLFSLEFRSIAYESASMVLARRELTEGKPLLNWKKFVEHKVAQLHPSQVYVGLGWAVAQEQLDLGSLLKELPPFWGMKTADGAGYYDGIFRNRQSIRGLEVPNYVPEEALPIYYQGLGRSLWYLAKGIPEHTKKLLLTFPLERHSDMWRGVGLACAYVGGYNASTLQLLVEEAGEDKKSLITGGLLAIESRFLAQSRSENMELCSELWINKTNAIICSLSVEMEQKAKFFNTPSYFDYVKYVELSLSV